MADTPKNPQSGRNPASQAKKTPPAAQPTRPTAAVQAPRMPARRSARHEAELGRQRIVVIATAAAIGAALLAVLIGIGYDQFWLPSRPVAQVGSASLTRRDYWQERRLGFAREIVQNFQLLALFGGNPQFTQQFANQSPNINRQIETLRSAPVDDAAVEQWQTLQLKEQGATPLAISVSQDEINQAMAQDLGQIFIPPPAPPITATTTLTSTGEPLPSAAASPSAIAATAEISATDVATASSSAVTATAEISGTSVAVASPTIAPTNTPRPTPQAAEALTQVDQIINEIFRRYEIELASANEDPILSKDDFRAAMNVQYREQVLNTKIQASLVPEAGFVFTAEPDRVRARQVLVAVAAPADTTAEQTEALFAAAKTSADAIAADLRGGADFATVASANSDDPGSNTNGGDLGLFDRDGKTEAGAIYPPELVAQAFSLEQGSVSDPIRTQFGWHIIEVTERDVPSNADQLREARTEALDTWVAERRTAIGPQRFPELTPSPTAPATTPTQSPEPVYQPGPPTIAPTATPDPAAATTVPADGTAPTSGTAAPATTGTAAPATTGTAAPATTDTAAPATTGTTAPTTTGTTAPATTGTAAPATTGTTAPTSAATVTP